jgi:hypothetical protein
MKHILVPPPPLLRDNIDPAGLFPAGLAPSFKLYRSCGTLLSRCHSNYNRAPQFYQKTKWN